MSRIALLYWYCKILRKARRLFEALLLYPLGGGRAMSAKVNKNGLNALQIKMAEMLADPESEHRTITELCGEIGVDRSTYYKYRRNNPKFREYVDDLIEKYTDSATAEVWRSLIKKCIAGDLNAIKLFFELKGKYKQQVQVDGGVVFISGEDMLEK